MPGRDDAADGDVPGRSRRPRIRLLSIVAVAAVLAGVLIWLVYPFETEAQRYVSDVSVRGYERVHDYIDFGTAPAEERAAIAVFVGPPDENPLARVSAPGLVVKAPAEDLGFRDFDLIGESMWHECGVMVKRWKTSVSLPSYFELTADQLAAFRAGRLSVLSVSVGCLR